MSTQIIVIGEKPKAENKKPIVFNKILMDNGYFDTSYSYPDDFEYIELISLNYSEHFDLIFAYNDSDRRDKGILFLGEWNDGIVK